jgi:superfamily II DNA or RNA helicase
MDITDRLRYKISQRALDLFERGHTNTDINNINIRPDITKKLMNYQILHTFNMISALKNNKIVIDGSYTGTGKTYTTAAACAQLGYTAVVFCPKSIIATWKNILTLFGVKFIMVVNYEMIRSCKYRLDDGKKVDCPYVKKNNGTFEWDFSSHPNGKNVLIIFDEVHRCKNYKSLNGRLLASCKNLHVAMLSATLCDKNSDFGIFGMMLGFYKNYKHGRSWMESILREDKNCFGKNKINTLHKYLFPAKGSKMALEDLGNAFPMNQISIESYDLDTDSKIKMNRFYNQIKEQAINNDSSNKLTQIIEMRQKIENLKVDILFDMMVDYHDQNRSVVVFVNYRSTYNLLLERLHKHNIICAEINGSQESEERDENINRFQNNEVRMIVCMIQAGGTSISLHDVSGRFPRVSIISPSYSRIELIQTLGRIFRNGGKSPCLQKIVYCSGTCEEQVADILRNKKETLDKITDDDMNIEAKLNIDINPKLISNHKKDNIPDKKIINKLVSKNIIEPDIKKIIIKDKVKDSESDSGSDSGSSVKPIKKPQRYIDKKVNNDLKSQNVKSLFDIG